ncbi:glycerate kinase [Gulosibacter molinativorax]|uniref:Glycerate kinase n=1 Tax=Gulosibacter molinativorax TaxID=256821 RepID=A0ABT7C8A7_9MICO|nr:glycerate kinase [Gulosibacter molinativorax]MDJ1371433.1 glycerate kinase [Gulosibacter molinativorax]QUY62931.1 Glycerate kinase I [Gulosibacter molinativorax]
MQRRIVIAPDSFKGTATATEVAHAIAAGWQRGRPGDQCILPPMADGGEGTIDALETAASGSTRVTTTVHGPLGKPGEASLLLLRDDTWVVELAETSGIGLLDAVTRESARAATTYGLGEAIRFAIDRGAQRVLVALGSSASTDGGVGALMALGARFLDESDAPIPLGNEGLHRLARVDLSPVGALPPDGIIALTDVTNPLLGPTGAAAVFGPQKGAAPEDIAVLEAGLRRLVDILQISGARADSPGAGAAGGTAFGLLAIGASIEPGALAIAEAIDLSRQLARADLVITGEGSFDAQSLAGKVPSAVLEIAAVHDVPVAVIAGRVSPDALNGDTGTHPASMLSLSELAGSAEATMSDPVRWLEVAGEQAAGLFNG